MHSAPEAFRDAILSALGHAPDEIEPGRLQRFATSCKRGDTAGWCKLFDDLRGGVLGCYRQGISETWRADGDARMTRAERVAMARQVAAAMAEREVLRSAERAENAKRIARLLADSLPVTQGDPVALYLKRRGFGDLWPLPAVLRLHRALGYWDDGALLGTFTAMLAPVVAPDGRTVAVHRTYLTDDGRKAAVSSPRKLTRAAGPLAGACIPLHGVLHGRIGIAEGIETALGAWCASGIPTVAGYSAGNLAAWQWPAGVRHLVVFADADAAGRQASETLRARAAAAGLRCEIRLPATDGADWCDVWNEEACQ